MGWLFDFFTGGTGRIQALIYAAIAMLAVCAALSGWALIERARGAQARVEAADARAEAQHWKDQTAVVADAAKACSAGVDQAKRTGDAAVKATGELVAAAARLNAPRLHTIERIETIVERPMTSEQAADCNWGWDQIEAQPRTKAGAP